MSRCFLESVTGNDELAQRLQMDSARSCGPKTVSLFFPFFCVRRSRYWHLASVSEGEREMRCGNGLRKMSEQKTAVSKTLLSLFCRCAAPPPPNFTAVALVTLLSSEAKGTPPLSLPSFPPRSVSQSNFQFRFLLQVFPRTQSIDQLRNCVSEKKME